MFYSGGGERVVIEEVKRLRQRGHTVKVYASLVDYERCFPGELEQIAPKSIVAMPSWMPNREALSMMLSTITGRRREFADCDVVLCHGFPSIGIGWKVHEAFGTPYVAYLHQIAPLVHPRPAIAGEWNRGSFRLLDWLAHRFADNVRTVDRKSLMGATTCLFNSMWTGSIFKEVYGISGPVCYPGVDHVSRLHTEERQHAIVTASRHYTWKRIDLTFDALKIMKSKPLFFVVGQETSYTKHLRRLVARTSEISELVRFLGFVDNTQLHRLFANCKGYVLSSIHEPFGITPVEAQYLETPVVVWGDAGAKETVLDGVTGHHAKPYDVADFADKVENLLTDKAQWNRMSRNAKEWASSFSWNRHVDILETALKDA